MDYFHSGDRIPYDGGADPHYLGHTDAPYTELSPVDEMLMEMSSEIRDRLTGLHLPYEVWVQVVGIVHDHGQAMYVEGRYS